MLKTTGISPDTRPFFVSNQEIRLLCLAYKEICDEMPAIFAYKHDDPAHLRVPRETRVYEEYKRLHGDELWRVGMDVRPGEEGEGGEDGDEVISDDGVRSHTDNLKDSSDRSRMESKV